MVKKYFQRLRLRGNSYEVAEMRELGERVRQIGIMKIDRSVFKKSSSEKLLLKAVKAQAKLEELRK